MNAHTPSPSSVFRELASAIGRDHAVKLVDELGGLRFYIPREIDPEHDIAKAIGVAAAAKLAYYFHGTTISLPMPRTLGGRRRVREIAHGDPGLTRNRIAKKTGYSERQIYRILNRKARPRRQGALFGDDD